MYLQKVVLPPTKSNRPKSRRKEFLCCYFVAIVNFSSHKGFDTHNQPTDKREKHSIIVFPKRTTSRGIVDVVQKNRPSSRSGSAEPAAAFTWAQNQQNDSVCGWCMKFDPSSVATRCQHILRSTIQLIEKQSPDIGNTHPEIAGADCYQLPKAAPGIPSTL